MNSFKGIWISLELIEMDISWTKRALISEISQLEILDKGCIASNDHFATKFRITKQAVSKALNELASDDIITIDNAQTKRNFGRTITINSSKSDVNSGKSAINLSVSGVHESVESKENNTVNKQKNNTIQQRRGCLWDKILEVGMKYQTATREDFFSHWTTLGDDAKRMDFEKCKTWSTERRLATWAKNNFNKTEPVEPTTMRYKTDPKTGEFI